MNPALGRDNGAGEVAALEKIVFANRIHYAVPAALSDLAGPHRGVLELPRTLYWGPEDTVDLADPVDIQRMYQAVVRTGTVDQQEHWLNPELLIEVWPTLVLPVRCSAEWESRFPTLVTP